MSDDVYVNVNTKKLEEISVKLAQIMRPVTEYDNKLETFLKRVISEQRERAAILQGMIFDIQNGQAD